MNQNEEETIGFYQPQTTYTEEQESLQNLVGREKHKQR